MEIETFLENLEYTNAYLFQIKKKKYLVTVDKQIYFPDDTYLQFDSWQDCLLYILVDKTSLLDLILSLQEYDKSFIYDIDCLDHKNRKEVFMQVTYYGHSCFKVDFEKGSIVFDPYAKDSVPGLDLPKDIHARRVLCSHQHADHNAKDSIILEGTNDLFKIKTIDVPHDDCDGKLRGRNLIHIVEMDGFKIVHFGDLGRPLMQFEILELLDSDLIMIPVGGFYTISSKQALEIIETLKPKTSILMHYKNNDVGYDVLEDIHSIEKEYPGIQHVSSSSISISKEDHLGILYMDVQK